MTGQLTFEPTRPKAGTLQAAVLELLYTYRGGICRRTAVEALDCYELPARIVELTKLGWMIGKRKCKRHPHRHPFVEYYLA